ncbi:MAG: hypothetical protein GWN58_33490 [Anaerolineae bacterium]|nr:hypothetical protein [Thermoplasmata archaeon]NIV34191.1 hypothetical protein [Anaerolineae bacterium]NIY06041.1 hypothetical protein [Thermoplasmata archaeon]
MHVNEMVARLQSVLTPDLLKQPYRRQVEAGANPLTGHCYVASEALYHLCGGAESGLTPCSVRHEGTVHWYLKTLTNDPIDPTAAQFKTPVPYEQGRGRGFLTKQPSKRAQTVIDRYQSLDNPRES